MRKVFVVALLAGLAGCAWAHARLTYEFVPLAGNSQILYEPGAEHLANLVDAHWLASVERVERRQYLPFKDVGAIRVYVFNDRNRYADFSRASVLTRGSSSANAVYLSEKLRERIDTLPGILVHELSHAHVRQHTGTFRYVTDLPGWFLEGLAVSVSAGAGAENVTAEQARAAMREGRRFEPADAGRWIGHRSARSYGLDPHTYYRQAGMFVEHLRTARPAEFEAALRGVLNGDRFRDVWKTHYGRGVSGLWQDYEKSIGVQDDAPPDTTDVARETGFVHGRMVADL